MYVFGGPAEKYKFYKRIGDPFKENNKYYIMVQDPFGKAEPIKTRFYTDKKHGAATTSLVKKETKYNMFGFKLRTDKIQIIRQRYLSTDEIEAYFYFNWRFTNLFDGCWYAPLDKEIPPIIHKDKIEIIDFETFDKEKSQYNIH